MALLQNSIVPAAAASDEEVVTRSLRFDGGNSRLSRTFSSAGDRKTYTFSCWVKKAEQGENGSILDSGGNDQLRFTSSDVIRFIFNNSNQLDTEAKFRDPSGWMSIVLAVDTTQSTSTDRVKIWVNGVLQTLTGSYPSQNATGYINNAATHEIGRLATGSYYYGGYIADTYFIDGLAKSPTDFIESNDYGGYKPKAYDMSSHGGNSFHLKFEDNTNIGEDSTSNGNDFTATNLASDDVVLDRPTNNYATLNPLERESSNAGGASLSQGNTMLSTGTATWSYQTAFSTIYGSGRKTYFECRLNSLTSTQILGVYDGDTGTSLGFIQYYTGTSYTQLSSGYHIIRVEIDPTQGASSTVKFYSGSGSTPIKSHTYDSSTYKTFKIKAYPITDGWGSRGYQTFNFGADSTFAGAVTSGSANASDENGNGDFYYSPPSGYLALCNANLDDPTVKPHENFEAVTYSGTGSAQNITTEFQPSLTWVKRRNSSANNVLTDSVRGANKALSSNTTSTEDTSTSLITAFNSTSFSVGTDSKVNASGGTYVGWNWKESATAGFDIVTYDGDGVSSGDSQSVSHSLGVAPDMIIVKARDGDAASDYYARDNWYVWHKDLATNELLFLNTTASAEDYSSTSYYSPISSVGSSSFTVKNAESYNYDYDFLNWGDPNGYYSGNIERYVAYLFSGVEGFSKFGKYTGNGSIDGPFVYCGFRPAYVMVRPSSSGWWYVWDDQRGPNNVINNTLYLNNYNTESGSGGIVDFLSNGFKIRTTGTDVNSSGQQYIYAAFAESPFKHANAR